MATPSILQTTVGEVTECAICTETMVDPKSLPCIHTYCFKCLDRLWNDKQPGETVPCPLCRTEFVIPVDGVSNLPRNFFVEKLLEAQRLSSTENVHVMCDMCSTNYEDGDGASVGEMFCVDCQQNMCQRCYRCHSSIKSCKTHRVYSLENKPDMMELLHIPERHCDQHKQEQIKIYCPECEVAVCMMCFITKHSGHKGLDVQEVVEDLKAKIKQDVQETRTLVIDVNEQTENLQKVLSNFSKRIPETESKILKRGEEIKELVDHHVQVLLQDLGAEKTKKLKEIECIKEELLVTKISFESFIKYSEKLLERAIPADIASSARNLKARAETLKNLDIIRIGSQIDVSFISSDLCFSRSKDDSNIIGEIKVSGDIAVVNSLNPLKNFIPMELGYVKVITKYLADPFRRIESVLKETGGKIEPVEDYKNSGFFVSNSKSEIDNICVELSKLAKQVKVHGHLIDRPGIPEHFYGRHGTTVLSGVEQRHNVSIQLDKSQVDEKVQKGKKPEFVEKFKLDLDRGIKILLIQGDITKFKVDAIVNVANKELQRGGGVAGAIVEADDYEIQEEGRMYIKVEGYLLPGQIYVSGPGRLPCRAIIHAVGPMWRGGTNEEDKILSEAVRKSLVEASDRRYHSIAIPAISCAIFGYPVDMATAVIVETIYSYLEGDTSTSLKEVYLLDMDDAAVNCFERNMRDIGAGHNRSGERQTMEPMRRHASARSLNSNVEDADTNNCPRIPEASHRENIGARPRTTSNRLPMQERPRAPVHDSRIVLDIYGLSEKSIKSAVENIEQIINEYILDHVMESAKDREAISKLDPDQIAKIQNLAKEYSVEVALVKNFYVNQIHIRGPPKNVTTVVQKINTIFQEVQRRRR